MNEQLQGQSRTERFRSVIADFIQTRKEAKLGGKEDDPATAAKYEYEAWLADAARRASQLQIVTHVLKATHPDARGTSVHVHPDQLPMRTELGTHDLGHQYVPDVVGNAAALDVFKLLKLEVEQCSLLEWARGHDPDLAAALHPDAAQAAQWLQAFGGLIQQQVVPVSHGQAKQLYWLTGDAPSSNENFHLLQPMFSSVLAHAVHAEVQDARFGEVNKLARQAMRAGKPHDGIYRNYPGLLARKLGGTKPQNISQLNSERGGVNYLLASLPPKWDTKRPRSLLGLQTVLNRLTYFRAMREDIKRLAVFLLSEPPSNDQTRQRRRRMEQDLGIQLAVFGAQLRRDVEPGWTRHPDCRLPMHEQLWLDPERTELAVRQDLDHPEFAQQDVQFQSDFACGDWAGKVAEAFAGWVNSHLRHAGLVSVGEVEYRHWARQAIVESVDGLDAETMQGASS